MIGILLCASRFYKLSTQNYNSRLDVSGFLLLVGLVIFIAIAWALCWPVLMFLSAE